MKKNRRKIILTIFSFATIFITAFATTMAWIGIFTYANTENFDISLKTVDFKSEYFLTISPSGEIGTYSDVVETDDLKKQILANFNIDTSKLDSSEAISYEYSKHTNGLAPITTTVNSDNSFSKFKKIVTEGDLIYDNALDRYFPNFVDAENDYLCFDLYLTVDTKEGISDYSEINAPVFLTKLEETIVGTISKHRMLENDFRKIDYSSNPYTQYLPYVPLLKNITDVEWINVNVANSVRIGFEVYEPIPIDESYTENNKIAANYIYYGGKLTPSLDSQNVYDLGGILPTEFNTAAQELMNMKSYLHVEVPNEALNRTELEINYENSQIWNVATDLSSPHNYLGVHNGVQTKMRLRTYLWFEGWDSDCLLGINNQNIAFNLSFTADHDDE